MLPIRRVTVVFALFLLIPLWALACSPTEPGGAAATPATGKATITADPNPVPAGAGWSPTTVTWDTGDKSWGQVYLFVEGQPEILFVQGPAGSKQAPWISEGPVYDFRLYGGKDRRVVLASVKVTRGLN